ncbi:MAG TPA: glycosyltransferase family 4 protein [Verrucomicrobiae bacterium]|nr:glycosyltransferase family 4 protein [Verrucomicrobiae bacterium]
MFELSKLRMCFLAGTLEHGGAERQLFYILQALRRAGNTPRLLSLDRGEFWEERIKSLGISVTCVGDKPSRLKRLLCVLKELRKDPPDVLQSQHFFANAYAGVTARLIRATSIGAMRNDGRSEMGQCGYVGGWLNLHSPGLIAANSQVAIQYAITQGIPASRLYFLPNVVDTDWFQPSHGLSPEPFTLLAVGRLVSQKRLDRFISILGRLRTDYHLNVRGVIAGPGCQDENLQLKLERQARQLGLFPEFIQFLGGVPDPRTIYRESAVCVLTSDHEGTPNVLLEAMASGLPVVASNVGGVPGIVRHGKTGYLFAPDDLDGFTAALAGLVKNSGLRVEMGQRARAFVEEHHALHRLSAYLDGLYQQALPATHRMRPKIGLGAPIRTETQSPRRA